MARARPALKRSKPRRRVRHWLAVGALAGCGSALGVPPALAQTPSRPSSATRQQPSQPLPALPLIRFAIPASTLEEALDTYQAETGIAVHFANPELRSLPSAGAEGPLSPEQALRRILGSLPATYRVSGKRGHLSITIELQRQSTVVEVQAAAPVMNSPKFSEPVLDTPRTLVQVPRQLMQQQAVSTLRDALRDVAGLSLAAGEGGSQGDNLTLRGFSARNDIFLDGLRDFGSYYRDPFDLEQVSVLEGPSGVRFGRGSTGGIVEQDSKQPEAARFLRADLEAGANDALRATVDYNHPLPALGPAAAVRVNLMGDTGDVPGREVAENRRLGLAPSLSLGLGESTQLTLSYLREDENDHPDYGIPWYFNAPAPVARENYYGFDSGNYLRTYVDMGTASLTHETGAVSLHDRARYARYSRHALITEPKLEASVTPQTPLDAVMVNRNQIAADSVETFAWNQTSATLALSTGSLRHTLVVGAEGGRETSDPIRTTWTGVPETSLLHPAPYQRFSGAPAPRSITHVAAVSVGVYLLDTIELGRHWALSGGGRWDRFATGYRQFVAPAGAFTRVDQQPTWRGALVYKPRPGIAFYADIGTSFNPSAESLSLSAATANLAPEQGKTYEAGANWNLNWGGSHRQPLALRASVFETDLDNVREPDPLDPLADVDAGQQRVRGLQFEASGEVAPGWNLHAGYALLDSRVMASPFYPGTVGLPLGNVPRHTFNAWLTHRLPAHIHLGAGSNFVARRTASSTRPFDPVTGLVKQAPGYWVFSTMVSYSVSDRIELQANVQNLFNRYYFDGIHPGHIIPGPGRVALIGFHFHF